MRAQSVAPPSGLSATSLGSALVQLGWDEPSTDETIVAHRIYVEDIQGRPQCESTLVVPGQAPAEDLQFLEVSTDGGTEITEPIEAGAARRHELVLDDLTPNHRHALALTSVDDEGNQSMLSPLVCANSSVMAPDAPRGCSIGAVGGTPASLVPLVGVALLLRRRAAAATRAR